MFQSDYRREMDRLAPSRPAMEKLEGLLAEGLAEGKRPRRRLAGGPPWPWPCAGR